MHLNTSDPACDKVGPIDHTCVAGSSADPQSCNADYTDLLLDSNQNELGDLRQNGTQCQTATAGTRVTFVFKDGNNCSDTYNDGLASCSARSATDPSCSGPEFVGKECFWDIDAPTCGEWPTESPSSMPSILPTDSAMPSVAPTGRETEPPETEPPEVTGDPHFKTWSGAKYDFHGVCDLVLLQNPSFQEDLGMNIHVRTKQLNQFSYVSSAVIRIGDDTFEVMGDNEDRLYWINQQFGQGNVDDSIIGFLSGYPIIYKKLNSKQHEYTVTIGDDVSIVMKTYKKFVRLSIEGATKESFEGSLGMLGSYGSGDMIARDGKTVLSDANEFGENWQVVPSDGILFHNKEGPQSPEKCEIPLASNIRRRLAESIISEEDAKIACARVDPSDFDICVFDVMATGAKDVVGIY